MKSSAIDIIARLAKTEGINTTNIPFIRIFKASVISEPLRSIYEPSLFIVLQGSKYVFIGGQTYFYDKNTYLISSVNLPVSGQIVEATQKEPFLSIQIVFDPLQIYSILERKKTLVETKQDPIALALTVQTLNPSLLEIITRLVQLLEKPDDIDFLAPMYQLELLYRLLQDDQLQALRQFAHVNSNASRIYKVITLLQKDFSESISIKQLADEAKMSIASLHKHFKELTAMSPIQYRKANRLQEAKRLMITEQFNASEAAYMVGYESPSQFSREYAQYFGLSPSKDIKQMQHVF